MRNRFLTVTVGGAFGGAVLFLILLLWTRALDLLNERSDLGVAAGVALLAAASLVLLALVGFAARRLLVAREAAGGTEERTPRQRTEAKSARSVCDELFAEQPRREEAHAKSNDLEPKGFRVDSVSMVGNPRLDPNVAQSINAVIQAAQRAREAQNKVAQVEAEARQKIAEAEGEAQKIRTLAEAQAAANERLTRSLTPELVQYQALQKWNGQLPQMTGGAVPFIQVPGAK